MSSLREQIAAAVEELAAIPYFPSETGARFGIMRQMERFVSGPRELAWLIDSATGQLREWRGIAELRGLYCTKFRPADGIEADCSIPGFTAADSETGYLELQAVETARRIEGYRRQKLLAAPGEVFTAAPELPPFKTVTAPSVDRTTRDVVAFRAAERLAATMGTPTRITRIHATKKRSDQETAAIVRDLERRLAERRRPTT